MTKGKVKYYLDYIPLVIFTFFAMVLIWTIATTNTMCLWKHYAGFIALPINYLLFWWRNKLGIIGLGLTILLGLFGFLSYDSSISITKLTLGDEGSQITIFYGQPIFLLWFLIHLTLSIRHYEGILTRKYWQELFRNLSSRSI